MQDLTDLGQTLHQIFIKADAQRQRAESAYDRFEQAIDDTGLPLEYWEPCVHRQLHLLQRHQLAAHRHFTRSLQNLQSFQKSNPAPKPAPTPEVITPLRGFTHRQIVTTKYVDGVLTTTTNHDAAYWLSRWDTLDAKAFIRYFVFPNADIPEPYRYLLINPEDDSIEPNPKPYIAAYYEPEEFYHICRLEVETQSPHLLGGFPSDITYRN